MLRLLMAVLVFLTFSPQAYSAGKPVKSAAETPLCSFAQITDVHIMSDDNPDPALRNPYQENIKYLTMFVNAINNKTYHSVPDFVVVTGDIANYGDVKSMEKFKSIMSKLNTKLFILGGNHDVATSTAVVALPLEQTNYAIVFGTPALNYEFEKSGVYFIGATFRKSDAREWTDWIIKNAEAHSNLPVVIATHYPAVSCRDGGAMKKRGLDFIPASFTQWLTQEGITRPVVFINGHNHINAYTRNNNFHQVNTSALVNSVCYRYFKVYKDRIEVRTVYMLPIDKLPAPKWNSPKNVDSIHSDVRIYHEGIKEEQEFVIPLTIKPEFYIQTTYQMRDEISSAGSSIAAAQEKTLTLSKNPGDSSIILDGRLDDKVWISTSVVTVSDFNEVNNAPVLYGTTAYFAYDDKNLYIGVMCDIKVKDSIKKDAVTHDGKVWEDDSIELYIDPSADGNMYYRIVVNTNNTVFDDRSASRGKTHDTVWDATGWKTAAYTGDKFWSTEFVVPINTIGATNVWGINLGHNISEGKLAVSLAKVDRTYHSPEKFIKLYFK
ncbi:MAG: sugar-binding protein [Elusimicrobiota bacterium]